MKHMRSPTKPGRATLRSQVSSAMFAHLEICQTFQRKKPTLLRTCRRLCCTSPGSVQRIYCLEIKIIICIWKCLTNKQKHLGQNCSLFDCSSAWLSSHQRVFLPAQLDPCRWHDRDRTEKDFSWFDLKKNYILFQTSLLSLPPPHLTNLVARAGFLSAARYHPCCTVFVGLDSTVPRSAHIAEKVQLHQNCYKYSSNTGVASFHRHR